MPTTGEIERIVISDQEGNYYLLSRDMLEKVRVQGDERKEVDDLVRGADMTGYSAPALVLNFFGTQLKIHGTCKCSFADCKDLPKALS